MAELLLQLVERDAVVDEERSVGVSALVRRHAPAYGVRNLPLEHLVDGVWLEAVSALAGEQRCVVVAPPNQRFQLRDDVRRDNDRPVLAPLTASHRDSAAREAH